MQKTMCYKAFCEIKKRPLAFLSFAAEFWSFSLLYSLVIAILQALMLIEEQNTAEHETLNSLLEQRELVPEKFQVGTPGQQ